MPEWGFRHDPTELESRLRTQSASNLNWYERFVGAARAARKRVDKTKSEKQRLALIYAAEAAADAVAEAVGQNRPPPIAVITALEAAAAATRITASIKRAEEVIAMVRDWEDEEEILMLLQ